MDLTLDALTAGVSRLCLQIENDNDNDNEPSNDSNLEKMEQVIGAIGMELNRNDHASAAAVSGGLLFDQLETIKTQILREFLAVLLARRHLQQQQQQQPQQQQQQHTPQSAELLLKEKERRLEVKLRLYRSLLSARMIAKLHNERSVQLAPLQQLPQQQQPAQQQQQQHDKRIVAMQRIASNLATHRSKSIPAFTQRHTSRFKKTAIYVHHHARPRPRSQPSSPTSTFSSSSTISPRSSFSSSSSSRHH